MLSAAILRFALLGEEWVLWLLVGLSLVCVGIALERAVFLARNTVTRAPFEAALDAYLRGGAVDELEKKLRALQGVEARVLLAGLEAAKNTTDAAEPAMIGTITFERLELERGLIVIGTVASNAPFLGLFGTVLGIIKAFHALSLDSGQGAAVVMAGISSALVATAVGLMVAIPSVVLYNYFTRRIKDTLGRVESLGSLVLSRLQRTQAA